MYSITQINKVRHEMQVHTDVRKSEYSSFDFRCTTIATDYDKYGNKDTVVSLRYYIKDNVLCRGEYNEFSVVFIDELSNECIDTLPVLMPAFSETGQLDYIHNVENILIDCILKRKDRIEQQRKEIESLGDCQEFNEED